MSKLARWRSSCLCDVLVVGCTMMEFLAREARRSPRPLDATTSQGLPVGPVLAHDPPLKKPP